MLSHTFIISTVRSFEHNEICIMLRFQYNSENILILNFFVKRIIVIFFVDKLEKLIVLFYAGFSGMNCETNVDDCLGNLCQNGATCVDGINSYTCLCPPTYMGHHCETDVDECSLKPSVCANGATCTNLIGSYSCICVNGWTGPDCSINIDDCASTACFNGATCIDRVGSFYCKCSPGKTGSFVYIIHFNWEIHVLSVSSNFKIINFLNL